MLDVKQEEIVKSRENRRRFENLYDAWPLESPKTTSYADALASRLTPIAPSEPHKEVQKLRKIRDMIRKIA